MTTPAIIAPRKLIEVALPLDDINRASAHEKSIRAGNPSTLHVWWAPRPLAAARAVLFAQLVNDPSWKYTEAELKKPQVRSAITRKRNELFRIISDLVPWANIENEEILERARREIRASWRETCEANAKHPDALKLFDPNTLPAMFDPFSGGAAIPLEAQRLGLSAHASDLNPVAVLIGLAKLVVPARFRGTQPVGPLPVDEKQKKGKGLQSWTGVAGLADDVRRYASALIEGARSKLVSHYPQVHVTAKMVKARPDLARYEGKELTVIAWIWARTVPSPNPALLGALVPLVNSFWLAKKPGKEAWVEANHVKGLLRFSIRVGTPPEPNEISAGTKASKGTFRCVASGVPISSEYIKAEGVAGRLGHRLMAIVCEGQRERVYLDPFPEHEAIAASVPVAPGADADLPSKGLGFRVQPYGFKTFRGLFLPRQQLALSTLASEIDRMAEIVRSDALRAGWQDGMPLAAGGSGARAYGEGIAIMLTMLLGRCADFWSTLATWSPEPKNELVSHAFSMHTVQMTWDFGEVNPFSDSGGSLSTNLKYVIKAVERLGVGSEGYSEQAAAQDVGLEGGIVSTDPPYYDNIGYADLSDYFYVWHRAALARVVPDLVASLRTPKAEELVSDPDRHGGREEARKFFLDNMQQVLQRVVGAAHPTFPTTIYYAFKQTESEDAESVSRGWETFLQAVVDAGLRVVGTWPVRTERAARTRGIGANALASSVVLVCRPRTDTSTPTKREFIRELRKSLPPALAEMTSDPEAGIAPVDLPQATIGPGMAVFSKYAGVIDVENERLSVRQALSEINKAIDEYFSEGDEIFDSDSRFCVTWFGVYGFSDGPFGEADGIARAKGTAVDGVVEAGVLTASKSKVRLIGITEYPPKWDPAKDDRLPVWEACHHMCRALRESEGEAGALLARMPEKQNAIRQLAYRLYAICEKQKWAEEARPYNELITSWPAIVEESHKAGHKGTQLDLV